MRGVGEKKGGLGVENIGVKGESQGWRQVEWGEDCLAADRCGRAGTRLGSLINSYQIFTLPPSRLSFVPA